MDQPGTEEKVDGTFSSNKIMERRKQSGVVLLFVVVACSLVGIVAASSRYHPQIDPKTDLSKEEENPLAWRLIEVGENDRVWMQRKDMLENLAGISGQRSHFFDVTDHQTLGPERAPLSAVPIPSQPKQQVGAS